MLGLAGGAAILFYERDDSFYKQVRYPPHVSLEQAQQLRNQQQYLAADTYCNRLLGIVETLIVATCKSQILASQGEIERSRLLLQKVLNSATNAGVLVQRWAYATLAELAFSLGDEQSTSQYYQQATDLLADSSTKQQVTEPALVVLVGQTGAAVLADLTYNDSWARLTNYWRAGIWHIWQGFDHLLFLITLLLPAVLKKQANNMQRDPALANVLYKVLVIVTAFTVAHSLTLLMAALQWINVSSYWVELTIALSVLLLALNNIFVFISGRYWLIALLLGFVHGFGFASVFTELLLTTSIKVVDVFLFNLGIETGQVIVTLIYIPIAYVMAGSRYYLPLVVKGGSLLVAIIAVTWIMERSGIVQLAT